MLYIFQTVFRPLSGAQNCIYSARYWSDQYRYLLLAWTDLTEINKLRNLASSWLYSANILAMHGPMNVKNKGILYANCSVLRYYCDSEFCQAAMDSIVFSSLKIVIFKLPPPPALIQPNSFSWICAELQYGYAEIILQYIMYLQYTTYMKTRCNNYN
jgi:hypothetical protein